MLGGDLVFWSAVSCPMDNLGRLLFRHASLTQNICKSSPLRAVQFDQLPTSLDWSSAFMWGASDNPFDRREGGLPTNQPRTTNHDRPIGPRAGLLLPL